ncbi:hypothetical protein L2E82_32669 [Cichorium intybus]|uniref:Uncharacterized protein n=1 Tax=Cichorium intybus TaxID=13427 RepID=A0ACB9BGZ1_CICIN|nr:hypothetical protein L2E82_32669 [Cichorium intybus]
MFKKLVLSFVFVSWLFVVRVHCEDPYVFFKWHVTFGNLSLVGVPQQVILINGKFPGPTINCSTNENIVVNVFNEINEPILFTWNGIRQRKNSWQDGRPGVNCPIQPGTNYTYKFQVKDQIGSFFYYPTTSLHRAAGGYGAINVHSRPKIPVPFDWPAEEFNVLIADWYIKSHSALKKILDGGKRTLRRPAGIIINDKSGKGDGKDEPLFTMQPGLTYRFRFCNVGLKTSLNVRFQDHDMKLVEIEGSHTVQYDYDSLDIHLGQCLSVLVTADQEPKDYYLVVYTRFRKPSLNATATIRYASTPDGMVVRPSAELPPPPPNDPPLAIAWSINQFRSFKRNLTASAARPNPQGSYRYGSINITRTIRIASSAGTVNGKIRYALNGISHEDTETPLKLAEYFGVADKVFEYNSMKDKPPDNLNRIVVKPNVLNGTYRNFVEIIFENSEKSIQSYHLSGYTFFAVAIESGKWSPKNRKDYNMIDAVSRYSIQVYPGSWAAILTAFDNAGMWNLRAQTLERNYLGQQLYISVLSPEKSLRDEYNIPETFPLCGIVEDMPMPPPAYTMF